ncbi:hypothetical protein TVAGG3_0301100 [Trichomonas vaginalis G3]|nr:hypothetical protein TVAGG3_0301100 [Trichomonas vaginalis G3]KAI5527895.1 hypothetical protein TVAGG3_0301100 [Trichomonas vaginalis G3]
MKNRRIFLFMVQRTWAQRALKHLLNILKKKLNKMNIITMRLRNWNN